MNQTLVNWAPIRIIQGGVEAILVLEAAKGAPVVSEVLALEKRLLSEVQGARDQVKVQVVAAEAPAGRRPPPGVESGAVEGLASTRRQGLATRNMALGTTKTGAVVIVAVAGAPTGAGTGLLEIVTP